MMPSTKKELHNISQRRRRTEPRPWETCTKISKDRACGSGDILTNRKTHRHTHIHTYHNTSATLTYVEQVMIKCMYMIYKQSIAENK